MSEVTYTPEEPCTNPKQVMKVFGDLFKTMVHRKKKTEPHKVVGTENGGKRAKSPQKPQDARLWPAVSTCLTIPQCIVLQFTLPIHLKSPQQFFRVMSPASIH